MIIDKEGNTLSTEKESEIRKSFKKILVDRIPLATAEQVNGVCDVIEEAIMSQVMQSYREGFHNGGAANGGMNRCSKMVLQFMRAIKSTSYFSPVVCPEDRFDLYVTLIEKGLGDLEASRTLVKEDISTSEALKTLARLMHIQMRLAWEMGIADMMTEAFEEVHASYMSALPGGTFVAPSIQPMIEKKIAIADKIRKDLEALKKFENEDHYKRPLTVEDIMDRPKEEHVEEERKETPAP